MKRTVIAAAGALLAASCSGAEAELARMQDLPQVVVVDDNGEEAATYDLDDASEPELFDPPAEETAESPSDGNESESADDAEVDPDTDAQAEDPAPEDPEAEPDSEPAPATGVPVVQPTIVDRFPHDGSAFTQGLEFGNGALLESLGLIGESGRRQVEPTTGEVIGSATLDPDHFGAGLTVVDDRIIQLTWRQGVAIVADLVTLTELSRITYAGEGWGLCGLDDGRLVMSNGSGVLTFRDATSFEPIGEIAVTLDGQPVENLNELECVGTSIYANVWLENNILDIDAASGEISRVIDATALAPGDLTPDDVLNGIAYRAESNTFFLTGKRWTVMYEVSFD